MSGPEIDRRCPDCGAAVRPNAAFCPQCGRPMKTAAALNATMPGLDEAAETPQRRRSDSEKNSMGRPLAAPTQPPPPPTATETPRPAATMPPASPAATTAPPVPEAASLPARIAREQINAGPQSAGQPEDGRRWRKPGVAAAARDVVEERLAPRVEKLRQASNVVLDEAADDPNLRFILIAVLLCVVAFILILISTYLQ